MPAPELRKSKKNSDTGYEGVTISTKKRKMEDAESPTAGGPAKSPSLKYCAQIKVRDLDNKVRTVWLGGSFSTAEEAAMVYAEAWQLRQEGADADRIRKQFATDTQPGQIFFLGSGAYKLSGDDDVESPRAAHSPDRRSPTFKASQSSASEGHYSPRPGSPSSSRPSSGRSSPQSSQAEQHSPKAPLATPPRTVNSADSSLLDSQHTTSHHRTPLSLSLPPTAQHAASSPSGTTLAPAASCGHDLWAKAETSRTANTPEKEGGAGQADLRTEELRVAEVLSSMCCGEFATTTQAASTLVPPSVEGAGAGAMPAEPGLGALLRGAAISVI